MITDGYEPRTGDRVRVRRYITPSIGERELTSTREGIILAVRPLNDGHLLTLDDDPEQVFTGYQFLGAGADRVSASLVTEVEPLARKGDPDVPEARRQLRLARARLADRFPGGAGKDIALTDALQALDDALGAGPEATHPETAEAASADAWRAGMAPDLVLAVDSSNCAVLEVTTPAGRVLRRVTVSPVMLCDALGTAASVMRERTEEADNRRVTGRHDRRRGTGQLERREAVDVLVDCLVRRADALSMVSEAGMMCDVPVKRHGFSVVYGRDGYYAVCPV